MDNNKLKRNKEHLEKLVAIIKGIEAGTVEFSYSSFLSVSDRAQKIPLKIPAEHKEEYQKACVEMLKGMAEKVNTVINEELKAALAEFGEVSYD